MLTCGVIICTRNRPDDLVRALESIAHQTYSLYELIIIDSSDHSMCSNQTVVHWFNWFSTHQVRFVYEHTRPGLPLQRNAGISHAHADVVYFFDDDVQLMPDYLSSMQLMFKQHPKYAGGMGNVINIGPIPSWRYRLFRTLFLLQQDYASGMFTASGMPTHVFGSTTFATVEVLSGCCMAYRRQILQRYTFDEKLNGYAYMEDCDMSRRVSREYPLFFNPEAKLYHFHSPVSRDGVAKNRAMLMRNYRYLFFKNFYPYNRLKIIAYVWSVIGLFLEAILLGRGDYLRGYWQGLHEKLR